MAIASMIIQSKQGLQQQIKVELSTMAGIDIHATSPKQELIITIEGATLDHVKEIAEKVQSIPGILGVFPTYITTDDEAGPQT